MKSFTTKFFQKNDIIKKDIKINNFLCNKSWYIFDEDTRKEIYIFRDNNKLVISVDGKVTRGTWEYIAENHSVIIEADGQSVMLHPTFVDNNIFVLQLDGKNEFAFLIEESKVLNSPFRKLSDIYSYFDNLQRQIEQEKEAKKQRLLRQKIEEEREEQRRLERIKEEEENRLLKERRLKWWNENKAKFLSNEKKYIKLVEELSVIEKKSFVHGICGWLNIILVAILLGLVVTENFGIFTIFATLSLPCLSIFWLKDKSFRTFLIACTAILLFSHLLPVNIKYILYFIEYVFFALAGIFFLLGQIDGNWDIKNKRKEIMNLEEELKNNLKNGKYDHLIF